MVTKQMTCTWKTKKKQKCNGTHIQLSHMYMGTHKYYKSLPLDKCKKRKLLVVFKRIECMGKPLVL